jgi:hypothetical protein
MCITQIGLGQNMAAAAFTHKRGGAYEQQPGGCRKEGEGAIASAASHLGVCVVGGRGGALQRAQLWHCQFRQLDSVGGPALHLHSQAAGQAGADIAMQPRPPQQKQEAAQLMPAEPSAAQLSCVACAHLTGRTFHTLAGSFASSAAVSSRVPPAPLASTAGRAQAGKSSAAANRYTRQQGLGIQQAPLAPLPNAGQSPHPILQPPQPSHTHSPMATHPYNTRPNTHQPHTSNPHSLTRHPQQDARPAEQPRHGRPRRLRQRLCQAQDPHKHSSHHAAHSCQGAHYDCRQPQQQQEGQKQHQGGRARQGARPGVSGSSSS